jgi:hypothetical protein
MTDLAFMSDAHVYDDSLLSLMTAFYDRMREERPRVLILTETWDPWKAPWAQIQATQTWAGFQALTHERADAGLTTVYIPGNHDTPFKKEWAPYAIVTNKWIESYPDCIYEFRHGWERDASWKWPLSAIAFWIADHCPSLMVPIHRALFGPTPAETKPNPTIKGREITLTDVLQYEAMEQNWNLHVGIIHTLWREYAAKQGRRIILGHSHCLWDFDGLIADGGAYYEDRAWLAIDGEKIELVEIGG